MKNTILISMILLGLISCEKAYNYPVEGETFGNYEHYQTMVKFDSNSIVSISVLTMEDSLMYVHYGTYSQMDDEISIKMNPSPCITISGMLTSDRVLTLHVGTPSQATFWRVRE